MEGAYELELHCHNCGDARMYAIEKGLRVPQVECENCGVKQLKRVAWIDRKKDEDDDEDDLSE